MYILLYITVQQQGSGTKRQRKNRSDHFKFRYKKSFTALLEEEVCV
jgi:hypothetical protein